MVVCPKCGGNKANRVREEDGSVKWTCVLCWHVWFKVPVEKGVGRKEDDG